jgi:hypothetical protein
VEAAVQFFTGFGGQAGDFAESGWCHKSLGVGS